MFWPGSQQFWRPVPGCGVPFSLRGERPGQPDAWRPLHGRAAPFPSAAGSGGQRFARALPGCGVPFPSAASSPGSRGLAPSPRARRTFSLRGPSTRRQLGLRKSLDRNRGLFAGWEGVASLGLSLPLAPPPASYLQRGSGGSSLEFLSPFALRTAGGVFQPVNFSLALPQFKKISLRLLSVPSGRSLP